ncbi:hypothetical protein [Bacteroides rodentium]|uniref:hypothetical protein n=1 Tax=Bacteroides rodentium TaxID=691816 RepID=UPI00047094D6|nr:hypothetical protein [Bacteroides rodentium]
MHLTLHKIPSCADKTIVLHPESKDVPGLKQRYAEAGGKELQLPENRVPGIGEIRASGSRLSILK